MRKKSGLLGIFLFNTRWLLYPMNLGLAVAGAFYMVRFLMEDYLLIKNVFRVDAEATMISLLGLVDMLMVANLVVMIYKGSHQIFIQKFSAMPEDRPQWLDHVDTGILKLKVASSVAVITLIRLLKDFINMEHLDWGVTKQRAIIHGVCLASFLIIAITWKLTRVQGE